MLICCWVVSNFNSHAGNTFALVVENNRLDRLKSTSAFKCAYSLKMIDMVACLVAHVINFFLIDIVNEAQV